LSRRDRLQRRCALVRPARAQARRWSRTDLRRPATLRSWRLRNRRFDVSCAATPWRHDRSM